MLINILIGVLLGYGIFELATLILKMASPKKGPKIKFLNGRKAHKTLIHSNQETEKISKEANFPVRNKRKSVIYKKTRCDAMDI
ncbi:hypothetical protein [Mariniflexile sp.]|uniref:hypothetical protein n=1 Tax=Mariniflexile sp. TaxID=1979402 RepID=UPI0040480282